MSKEYEPEEFVTAIGTPMGLMNAFMLHQNQETFGGKEQEIVSVVIHLGTLSESYPLDIEWLTAEKKDEE